MNSEQLPIPEQQAAPASDDEFAAGAENGINRAFFRLMNWVFAGPHFPSELTWLLVALSVTGVAFNLLRQRPEYWLDASISGNVTFVGAPLSWGPLTVLALNAAYWLAIALVARAINARLALPIWTVLCLLQLLSLPGSFACWSSPPFAFIDMRFCSAWHVGALLVAGLVWATALAGLVSLGLIPLNTQADILPENGRKPGFNLPAEIRFGSMAWICLLGLGVGFAAFPARPGWKAVPASANTPSARVFAAAAYDTRREKAVLFGGTAAWSSATDWVGLGDTWEWDGAGWQQLAPVNSPAPRQGAAMAYDAKRGVMVLFGGRGQIVTNGPVFFDDTWEWNGENWTESKPEAHPSARSGQNLYYDPQRQTMILYGGYIEAEASKATFFKDTWEWDGLNWIPITLQNAREDSGFAVLYYEKEQMPMLMDGQGLWVLKDSRWGQPNYPQTPPARWAGGLAFDALRQQVIVFGGYQGQDKFNDTWSFNGQTWKKLVMEKLPPARYGHNLFFDVKRKKVMLFGGFDGKTFMNDMWELVLP
jgi:hypothetical protein